MTKQEMKAREILRKSSTEKLLALRERTAEEKYSQELATVRGWLMDEIESRNASWFDAWLSLDAPEDMDLKKYILTA